MERREVNLVEVNLPALYNGRGNEAADQAAKNLLFNSEDTYTDWDQHVYTRRYTLYGVDENRRNSRMEFAVIDRVGFDGEGNPGFAFIITEGLSKLLDNVANPVIVCSVKLERLEDGTYKARKPKYNLCDYDEYMENEKRRLERQVFRKGSVFPKKGLTSTIKDQVDDKTNTAADTTTNIDPELEVVEKGAVEETPTAKETVEYEPVTVEKTPEEILEEKVAETKATLTQNVYTANNVQPMIGFDPFANCIKPSSIIEGKKAFCL